MDETLKQKWTAYITEHPDLDGAPDFDLRLYVRRADREEGCTILRPGNLAAFKTWREKNQTVIRKALDNIHTLQRKGKGHYSIDDVISHFRHFEDVEQTDPSYKINDHVEPLLGRCCIFNDPQLREFFEIRSPNPRKVAAALVRTTTFEPEWNEAEWIEVGKELYSILQERCQSVA